MCFALLLSLLTSFIMLSTTVEVDNSFKAYMDYRTLNSVGSEQLRLQEMAWTDTEGFRRMGANRYMVALGSYYTGDRCGKLFIVEFEDGTKIKCITGDVKADVHTDESNRYTLVSDDIGCIVEFIVDVNEISDEILKSGDCSSKFPGKVAAIYQEVQ